MYRIGARHLFINKLRWTCIKIF